MQVKLENITGIASPQVAQFDLHEEFGATCLVEAGERVTLFLNQIACRSWLKQEHPHIVNIKWFDFNSVILYYDGIGAAIVSVDNWHNIRLYAAYKLFISTSYSLVAHDEESLYGSRPGELESNIISVFLRDGTLELGIGEFMEKDRDSWQFNDLEAGYTYDDHIVFICYVSHFVWTLDVPQRTWKKVPFAFEMTGIDVLSGDDKTAYAIFDHRRLLSVYPDRPPFELAVFDLLSETSSKQDFALIETELMTFGFEMSEIKFQPSSTGKIIVSDGKKAALLEFSD